MSGLPWTNWIPGVLSKEQTTRLVERGYIEGVGDPDEDIDHSSIDLHITDEGYELTDGSVKPSGKPYFDELQSKKLIRRLKNKKSEKTYTLKPKTTYLFKIRERLGSVTPLADANIYGQATAKSSVGRVDVLARLIVDGANSYEGFTPDELRKGNGMMYLEITPITFKVLVRKNIALTQLRFFLGNPENVAIKGTEVCSSLLRDDFMKDGTLSVDLSPTKIGGQDIIAFWATKHKKKNAPIKLWRTKKNKPNPCNYWKLQGPGKNNRLKMKKEAFYILRSKERIALPEGIAVYCKAIDETIGEMRIHYAGFVHPFFGLNRTDDKEGTPLIFEVRVHDTFVSLQDKEKLARLIFYRMSQDAKDKPKKNAKDKKSENTKKKSAKQKFKNSSYNDQELKLSDFFKQWPNKLKKKMIVKPKKNK